MSGYRRPGRWRSPCTKGGVSASVSGHRVAGRGQPPRASCARPASGRCARRACRRSFDASPRGETRSTRFAGRAEAHDRSASWDLEAAGAEAALRHLPRAWMYRAPLPRTKRESPLPDAVFAGTLEAGERRIEVAGWRGMVGHNWGSEHAERWVWLHALGFAEAPGAWLDVALGRVQVGGRTTPWVANGAGEHDVVDPAAGDRDDREDAPRPRVEPLHAHQRSVGERRRDRVRRRRDAPRRAPRPGRGCRPRARGGRPRRPGRRAPRRSPRADGRPRPRSAAARFRRRSGAGASARRAGGATGARRRARPCGR